MAIVSSSVGVVGKPATDVVEDRWLSNYAASVNDLNDRYYENRTAAPAVHPAYVSHLEWDAIGLLHEQLDVTPEEAAAGVHSYNHTILHSGFGRGDELRSQARLVGVEQTRAGGRLTMLIETTVEGRPVATSHTQTVFRGIPVTGADVVPELTSVPSPPARDELERMENIVLSPLAPYHFSECARDYGAIHTDRRVADAAGLPGLILHGTGTFAYALSSIVNHEAGGDPGRVVEFGGRLGAMLPCPSEAHLFARPGPQSMICFDVLNELGQKAVSDGFVKLR